MFAKKIQFSLECIQKNPPTPPLSSSYFIFPNSIVFHENQHFFHTLLSFWPDFYYFHRDFWHSKMLMCTLFGCGFHIISQSGNAVLASQSEEVTIAGCGRLSISLTDPIQHSTVAADWSVFNRLYTHENINIYGRPLNHFHFPAYQLWNEMC